MNKGHLIFPILARKLGWGIIFLLLLFLPFQIPIWKGFNLSHHFLWVDEALVVLAFTLFFLMLLYQGKIKTGGAKILFCLLFLGIIGIISGLYNATSSIVAANGIFDYIKNFLVIPVFCLFSISESKATNLYKILHRLALFLCLVAILQEIGFSLGFPVEKIGVSFVDIRFGLMRTPSLMGHPNIFGLYVLLFFTLDFSLHRRVRWQNLLFASGIFLSISRMIWITFFLVALIFLFHIKNKKSSIVFFIIALLLLIIGVSPLSKCTTKPVKFLEYTAKEMSSEGYFRGYALSKSLEIWKDHPILGVGPGMYGGVVSFVFNSSIYKQYDFSSYWFNYMSKFRSLDQFWPQILAEMGLLGALGFAFLLFTLWRVAKKASLVAENPFREKMLSGFLIVPVIIGVYLLGSGENLTAFLLTYNMLFGMVLGIKDESPIN